MEYLKKYYFSNLVLVAGALPFFDFVKFKTAPSAALKALLGPWSPFYKEKRRESPLL